MPTIKDVASVAGVAPSVVSRLLNGDTSLRIRPETRDRIHAAVSSLGYTPNLAARALRAGRSGAVALALHDVVNPVYAEIVAGAQEEAANLDQALLLGDVENLARGRGTLTRMIAGGALDGLIMQGARRSSDEVLARLGEKVPTVMLQEDPRRGVAVVGLPDEHATTLATEHLLSLGHTRIGCITTVRGTRQARDRLRGWRISLRHAGVRAHRSDWVWSSWTDAEAGARAMERLLEGSPNLTAVVVCNVVEGIGAISAAVDRGYRVPEDLSVVAVHEIPMARFTQPPLTTVRLPLAELGRRAVQLLSANPFEEDTNIVVTEPAPELVLRGSTGPARA